VSRGRFDTPAWRTRATRILALCLLVLGWPTAASAQEVEWSGEVSTALDALLFACDHGQGCELANYSNRNVLRLEVDVEPSAHTAARGEVALHNVNVPTVSRHDEVHLAEKVQPISVRMGEVWVAGYDLFAEGLDLKVGSQLVRWGTGDGYSPSDRVNPVDLEDPFFFDRRLPVPAAHLSYRFSEFGLSATWLPFFTPGLMANSVFHVAGTDVGTGAVDLQGGVSGDIPTINAVTAKVVMPDQALDESGVALRAEWASSVADFALGWFYGRDSLPQLDGEVVPENFFSGGSMDIRVTLAHPRFHMLAAEARAPLFGGLSAWADVAVFLPTRTTAFITKDRLDDLERLNAIEQAPDGDIVGVVQTGDPYVTAVAGVDITLVELLYLNLQYVHGFLFERNADDPHHYLFAAIRLPSDDRFWEVELRGGVETNQAFDAGGWLAQASVALRYDDVMKFALLGVVMDGQSGTTLSAFHELSEVRVEVSAAF